MTRHIVLLGDSIFDNALYVPGEPSVLEHVRRILPSGDCVTMLALDGATVSSVFGQLDRIPDDATHLVLSVGGNDALWMSGNIFSQSTDDMRSALRRIAEMVAEFTVEYHRLISDLRACDCRWRPVRFTTRFRIWTNPKSPGYACLTIRLHARRLRIARL